MRLRIAAIVSLFTLSTAFAENVRNPQASFIDVPARQAYLAKATNPVILTALKNLPSCVNTPAVPAPTGHIIIPPHYLNGSHGPTNPAEHAATRPYGAFENRITAGMNQYVATGSHTEAACALAQLDTWAQAKAMLDYDAKESSQAWFQIEWTLCASGTTLSVLVNDPTLDPAQKKRVTAWLDASAHKMISFEKPGEGNNHHYWRGLAAISIGVTASDNDLFHYGLQVYKESISQLDNNGAFPLEMARHERATHYQFFALQPLVLIAEFAERQGIDLYAYTANKHTLRDAILFVGKAVEDPTIIKQYTSDEQMADYNAGDYAPFAFYVARFGSTGLSHTIIDGLNRPTEATRIGGSTTILVTK